LTKISKVVQEPQSEAMKWGNEVHKALELRVTINKPLPETMQSYEPIAASIIKKAEGGKLQAEQKMAINSRYIPTTWFAKDVWVRGITDVQITKGSKMFIGDYKTGKPDEGSAQLKLTAAMAMHHNPKVNTVINTFVWLKTGTTTTETFTREDIPTIWQEFAPRVQRLEHAVADNKFPARPSGLCRAWCPVGKANCEHCGT
jgi:hypothetical protein